MSWTLQPTPLRPTKFRFHSLWVKEPKTGTSGEPMWQSLKPFTWTFNLLLKPCQLIGHIRKTDAAETFRRHRKGVHFFSFNGGRSAHSCVDRIGRGCGLSGYRAEKLSAGGNRIAWYLGNQSGHPGSPRGWRNRVGYNQSSAGTRSFGSRSPNFHNFGVHIHSFDSHSRGPMPPTRSQS